MLIFLDLKMSLDVIRLDSNEHGSVENAKNSSFHKSGKKPSKYSQNQLTGILETNKKFTATGKCLIKENAVESQ